jgi:hypothetical protein
MSCYEECNEFLKSNSKKDLGDIREQGSCSYCLYWNGNGPGAEGDSNKDECKCDDLFENLTNFGTKYNLNIHNQVKQCLSQNQATCSKLYKQFTSPDKPYDGPRFGIVGGEWGRMERYEQPPRFREFAQNLFKEDSPPYGYYNQCTGKRASPGFSREGVL